MVLGAVGKSLNEFMPAVKQGVMQNEDVQKYVQKYMEENNLNPTPEQQEVIAMKAVVESAVGTFVDAFVLMQRIREDSDAFRSAVIGPEVALEGIGKEAASDERGVVGGARHGDTDGPDESEYLLHELQYGLDHGTNGQLDALVT